jgi:hypothetical protein
MTGTALNQFNDFVEATGPTYVTGPRSLINEAVKNTYYFGQLASGDDQARKMIRGGADIRESLFFQDNGTFETYLPGAEHDWKNPQRLEKVKTYWRFCLAHMSWVEQEILLNERINYGSEEAKFQQYVEIRNEKEALMWTAMWNGLENLLWAEPNADTMEAEAGTEPFSIPAFLNEATNGLFLPLDGGTNWTTVEGLDPTAASTDSKWKPQTATYSSEAVNNQDNIISSLDELVQDVEFQIPTMHKQYFEDPTMNRQMILTTKKGRAAYAQLLREGQDHYVVGNQDPAYPDPQYYGIPIKRVSTLETATLYGNTSSDDTVAEDSADNKGPRFYVINGNYMYPVFHQEMYFEKKEVTKHHNVPDTWVCPVSTWYNMICTSRQRQGILSPSGDRYYA